MVALAKGDLPLEDLRYRRPRARSRLRVAHDRPRGPPRRR
jgi:hypothetical protein